MNAFFNFIGNLLLTLFILAIIGIVLVLAFSILTSLLAFFTLLLPFVGIGIFAIIAISIVLTLFSP